MRFCLIGLPQSGKTSLFSAVVEAGGTTVDTSRPDQPHSAMVKVPDARVDYLAEVYDTKKTVYTEIELMDLPGFDLSDDSGRDRARTHWMAMKQSDMLVFVVRSFENDAVPVYGGSIEPSRDIRQLLDEMLFADLEQVTNRIEKLEKSITRPTPEREKQVRELEIMKRIYDALENEQPVSSVIKSPVEEKIIRSFAFLTLKPKLVVLNYGEGDDIDTPEEVETIPAMGLNAEIEREIAQLPEEERGEFLADIGQEESASDRFVRAAYRHMGLISYITGSEKECRAWTIREGTTAVDAAGEIHSDLARGFIRAETISFEDFKAAGGEMKDARASGNVRLEGKEYIVKDGDVIHFRFNV